MGLFDRRKDATTGSPEEPVTEEPVSEELAATKKVAAAPPAPPTTPAAKQAAEPEVPAPVIHTVAAGESLADVAGTYGVPAEEIARQNHLPASGAIYPGQVFVIRS